jgi:hypothetical protein
MALRTPDDFLAKMDYEGYNGIEWFGNDTFDDPKLQELVQQAYFSWVDFRDDLDEAEARAQELVDEDDTIDT